MHRSSDRITRDTSYDSVDKAPSIEDFLKATGNGAVGSVLQTVRLGIEDAQTLGVDGNKGECYDRENMSELWESDNERTDNFDMPLKPSGECFLFQCMINELYTQNTSEGINKMWDLRRLRLPSGILAEAFWEDYLTLFAFAERNNLSEAVGDEMLQMISDITLRHGIILGLPQCFRTIKRAFTRHKKKFPRTLMEVKVYIPSELFPQRVDKGSNRRQTDHNLAKRRRISEVAEPICYAIGARTSMIEAVSHLY